MKNVDCINGASYNNVMVFPFKGLGYPPINMKTNTNYNV